MDNHTKSSLALRALLLPAAAITAVLAGAVVHVATGTTWATLVWSIGLVVTGGPRLGDMEAGVVAQAFSPWASVVSGGLLCIAGAGLVAWLYPELRRYHAGQPG